MTIKILDCTLRDGGYVNDFAFGEESKSVICKHLIDADIDIVELGFLKTGKHNPNLSMYDKISDAEKYIVPTKSHQSYCLMVRPDWFDINLLESAKEKIHTLRFAFHGRDLDLTLRQAKIARELGYSIYLNPVNITSYEEDKLILLLTKMNDFAPDGVSIVDTFGSLLPNNFKRILNIFHNNLEQNLTLGLHLHENLSLSMGLASFFLNEMMDQRNLVIDSSLLGMGRIPGNLCTELISGLLNEEYGRTYNQKIIYQVLSSEIQPLREKFVWGYLPQYAKTGFEKVHRDYAEYLIESTNFSIEQIFEVIEKISINGEGNEFKQSVALKYIS